MITKHMKRRHQMWVTENVGLAEPNLEGLSLHGLPKEARRVILV